LKQLVESLQNGEFEKKYEANIHKLALLSPLLDCVAKAEFSLNQVKSCTHLLLLLSGAFLNLDFSQGTIDDIYISVNHFYTDGVLESIYLQCKSILRFCIDEVGILFNHIDNDTQVMAEVQSLLTVLELLCIDSQNHQEMLDTLKKKDFTLPTIPTPLVWSELDIIPTSEDTSEGGV
jgi:hypothetical protein